MAATPHHCRVGHRHQHQQPPKVSNQHGPELSLGSEKEQDQQESDDDAVIVVTYTMTAHDVASLDALRDELMVLVEEIKDSEPGTLWPIMCDTPFAMRKPWPFT